jgi:hypothetical protein
MEATKPRAKKRKQRDIVIIVCQGKQTEPNYFKHFKNDSNFVLHIKKRAEDPVSLVKYAKYLKEVEFDIGPKDRVYCVYDVDNTSDEALNIAKKNASQYGISSCISNPCFELWYLLHFIYSTSCLDSYDDVKNELLKYISYYEKNKDVFERLISKQSCAIENAKKLEKHHTREEIKSIRRRNPSTHVYDVVEYLNKLSK